MHEIAHDLGVSLPTLQKQFDAIEVSEGLIVSAGNEGINLLIDATFFGQEYGYLCFHDTHRVIYFHEIKTETIADLKRGLSILKEAGYRFKSVTIDGRKGYYRAIRHLLGGVPIQMCLFHQKAIVRRYLTDQPASRAGQDLKALMDTLRHLPAQAFIEQFYGLKQKHHIKLHAPGKENENVKAAYRSVQENMPQIFTFQDIPEANIPTTINHLEGTFAHLKEKIKIHRGLKINRKKKAIRFLLTKQK